MARYRLTGVSAWGVQWEKKDDDRARPGVHDGPGRRRRSREPGQLLGQVVCDTRTGFITHVQPREQPPALAPDGAVRHGCVTRSRGGHPRGWSSTGTAPPADAVSSQTRQRVQSTADRTRCCATSGDRLWTVTTGGVGEVTR